MKSRPRRAENRIAQILSDFFCEHGLSPIERIPVLGRTGPDLTINESGLVIDVKSRQSCPISVFKALERTGRARNRHHSAFQLDRLEEALLSEAQYMPLRFSKTVDGWLDHMEEWTGQEAPWGISALVLHRPQMPYGQGALVLARSDVRTLQERIRHPNMIGGGEAFILPEKGSLVVCTKSTQTRLVLSQRELSVLDQWIQGELYDQLPDHDQHQPGAEQSTSIPQGRT